MRIEATLAGLDTLIAEGMAASADLDRALASSVDDAAEKGIVAFTDAHPYTDRTFNLTASARVEPSDRTEAPGETARDMVWGGDESEAPYAVYVEAMDNYQFTPVAREEAERVLQRDVEYAVDLFEQKLSGK